MSQPALSVENIGKAYQLMHESSRAGYTTLRDSLANLLTAPMRRLREGKATDSQETFWAVKDVSFDVHQGEVVGIIGRNGAGKSTLLKILSRITKPTTGRCVLRGRVGSLLEVGTGFHPELTGRENIFMNGSILGMSNREIKRNFDAIVEFAEVEKFLDTPVKRYSSGMYVRLAFAVAAHLEPEILIVDEVLAVGDSEFQAKCLGKMGDVAKSGRTVLFVSHNMPAVTNLCTRAVWLKEGTVFADADTQKVVESYLQNSSYSTVNIENRLDRSGSGVIRFTGFSANTRPSSSHSDLQSGNPAYFTAKFKTGGNNAVNRIQVAVIVRDKNGLILFTLSTHLLNLSFDSMKGECEVRAATNALPLNEGEYSIDLWGGQDGITIDYIENAGKFTVNSTDVFNSGKVPVARKHGIFFVHHSWERIG